MRARYRAKAEVARARSLAVGVACLALVASCAEDDGIHVVEETRIIDTGDELLFGATLEQRFGVRSPGAPKNTGSQAAGLEWETPAGWVEIQPSSMRVANFLVAGSQETECYLTTLPGEAGGLAANVNRWRKQMALPSASAEELAAMPRESFMGSPAAFLDIEGTWSGMGGDRASDGYRLIGLLSVDSSGSNFLKMVGPKEIVGEQIEAFRALAASFEAGGDEHEGHDHGPGGHGASSSNGSPGNNGEPHQPAAGGPGSANGIAWVAPSHWRAAPDRPMRLVNFHADAEGLTECYVTILGGDGGGALANINRWRGQMGQGDLSREEFDGLRRVGMFGAEGVVVETRGSFQGMSGGGIEDALLFGAVCTLPGQAVFVKMIGPSETTDEEWEAFVAFCKSLEFTR